jgi:hypothetical protein
LASFRTHLYGGVFVSGGAVVVLHELGLLPPGAALPLFALGVAGSLLPDIDADASAPVRAFFGLAGVAFAFAWTLPMVGERPVVELVALWAGLFLVVRFLLYEAFTRFTVHRGLWHSLLAAAFAGLVTVDLAYWILRQPPAHAWIAGLMVGLGYLAHLVLDEVSSVDLLNARVRRSFGTALKPLSLRNLRGSLAMTGAIACLLWIAPLADGGGAAPGASAPAGIPDLLMDAGERLGLLFERLGEGLPRGLTRD